MQSCMMGAPQLADWMKEHPAERLAGWRYEFGKRASRGANGGNQITSQFARSHRAGSLCRFLQDAHLVGPFAGGCPLYHRHILAAWAVLAFRNGVAGARYQHPNARA